MRSAIIRSEASIGGMITKLAAGKLVTAVGIPMQIANGRQPDVLIDIFSNKRVGTLFQAQ